MKKSKRYFVGLFEGKTGVERVDKAKNTRDGQGFYGLFDDYPVDQLKVNRVVKNEKMSTHGYPTVYPIHLQKEAYNTSKTGMSTVSTPAYPRNEQQLKYQAYYDERAGIFEHEGGLTRSEAEYNAYLETLKEFIISEHPDISTMLESILKNK